MLSVKYILNVFKDLLWLTLFVFCGSLLSSKVENRSHRHEVFLAIHSIRPLAEIILETIIYFLLIIQSLKYEKQKT